ncbi:MAG: DUF2974 domain-containing protein [Firmicutes bacterium]|nr:DUF2974 domain-containing protein [Bacillota bacterium]
MGKEKRKKLNMQDYLDWRGDLTFKQDRFNEVDGIIMSVLTYINLDCVKGDNVKTLSEVVQILMALPDDIKYDGTNVIRPSVETAVKAARSRRFRDVLVSDFRSEIDEVKEIQFAAVTFTMPDNTIFVAFRGTDNTIVGWKEDFNMSFNESVPAQQAAAVYLADMAKKYDKPIRTGGHSKGGNISVWAAANLTADQQERIIAIYNNDGPGFTKAFLSSPGYLNIRRKIHSFVPESSIIGVLMDYDEYVTIASSSPSVAQHMPASWLVSGPRFVRAKARTKSGDQLEKIVRNWKDELTEEERREFIDAAYGIIASSNAKKLDDFDGNRIKSILTMQKSYKNMDPEKQKLLLNGLTKMISVATPDWEIKEDSIPGNIKKRLLKVNETKEHLISKGQRFIIRKQNHEK